MLEKLAEVGEPLNKQGAVGLRLGAATIRMEVDAMDARPPTDQNDEELLELIVSRTHVLTVKDHHGGTGGIHIRDNGAQGNHRYWKVEGGGRGYLAADGRGWVLPISLGSFGTKKTEDFEEVEALIRPDYTFASPIEAVRALVAAGEWE
jgi:hypothetical protein